MAARNKIGRLTVRIEALAARRWPRHTLKDLTDEAWTKLEARLEQLKATSPPVTVPTSYAHFSDDALIRCLMEAGWLTAADFRRRPGCRMKIYESTVEVALKPSGRNQVIRKILSPL
jgi:hypothetical protein